MNPRFICAKYRLQSNWDWWKLSASATPWMTKVLLALVIGPGSVSTLPYPHLTQTGANTNILFHQSTAASIYATHYATPPDPSMEARGGSITLIGIISSHLRQREGWWWPQKVCLLYEIQSQESVTIWTWTPKGRVSPPPLYHHCGGIFRVPLLRFCGLWCGARWTAGKEKSSGSRRAHNAEVHIVSGCCLACSGIKMI